MQEEVEQKTIALAINATKLTGRELKKAIVKLLAHLKDKQNHPNIPQGKQSVKQLAELRKLAELAKNTIVQKVKHKDKEQSL